MIDWNQKTLSSWKKSCDKFRKHIKKQRHSANSRHFANKALYSQSYGAIVFPVVMGCEGWTIKKAEHWKIDAFELWCWRRLLRVLDSMEIQPADPKGYQSWIFLWRTDAEAEASILWPPIVKSQLIWKDLDAVKDWGQEEKGTTEDEKAGGQQWFSAHELSKLWEVVNNREAWRAAVPRVTKPLRHDWVTEQRLIRGTVCITNQSGQNTCYLDVTKLDKLLSFHRLLNFDPPSAFLHSLF